MASRPKAYYVVNGITLYRLLAAVLLLWLALNDELEWFRWLLMLSFFTDAIDGTLSRMFKVESVLGAKLDSIADDATVLSAIVGMFVFHTQLVREQWPVIMILLSLFAAENMTALLKFARITSFHTFLAKTAAVLQALFFIGLFFNMGFERTAFAVAAIVTGIQLLEEILLVIMLREWKSDVPGLLWLLRHRTRTYRAS